MTNPVHQSAKRMAKEWRPIKTAPLSQAILVWDGKFSGEARYYDSAKGWWWVSGDPTDYYDRQCFPTHWMPLPDGPEA